MNINLTNTDINAECSSKETVSNCSAGLRASDTSFGLQHFLYNNSQILEKIKGHLVYSNFTGITVSFMT